MSTAGNISVMCGLKELPVHKSYGSEWLAQKQHAGCKLMLEQHCKKKLHKSQQLSRLSDLL